MSLKRLGEGGRLSFEESYSLALSILRGDLGDVEVAAALTAMRVRGEEAEEVAGFAKAARDSCVKVDVDVEAIDTAGTGGDGQNTINLSTAAAVVASAAGAYVLKHGNRSVTSPSGSADFLEALGYNIMLKPDQVVKALKESRFAFLFAPAYHPTFAKVAPIRKRLPFRTIFNIIGPLANPAHVGRQVIGVAERRLLDVVARAGLLLSLRHLVVLHGEPGIDEASIEGATEVAEVRGGSIERYMVYPEDLGARRGKTPRASSREESVARTIAGLGGRDRDAAEAVAVNAAFALYVSGIARDLKDGYELAKSTIHSGEALRHLERIIKASR
ncbi:MAG: anthranilate phosphoribosyltransferase [Thermoproteus sp.]|nr:anthranilate phosphoribosyltransferase [Thermoproteus sp.]